jgi:oxaloacetate decarboxylase beta subunit
MMTAKEFLRLETIMIYLMGVVAFAVGTAAGVILGKVMYLASGKRVNPLIGAAGISAFPMCARVVQKVGLEANPHNHLIMHAAGANTAGQIASVVAGGAALALVPFFR